MKLRRRRQPTVEADPVLLGAFGILSLKEIQKQVVANHASFPRAERARRRAVGKRQRAARRSAR